MNAWEIQEVWTLAGKAAKFFGLDVNTFDRRWIFLFREIDNNYSISTTIFSYNPEISF